MRRGNRGKNNTQNNATKNNSDLAAPKLSKDVSKEVNDEASKANLQKLIAKEQASPLPTY